MRPSAKGVSSYHIDYSIRYYTLGTFLGCFGRMIPMILGYIGTSVSPEYTHTHTPSTGTTVVLIIDIDTPLCSADPVINTPGTRYTKAKHSAWYRYIKYDIWQKPQ